MRDRHLQDTEDPRVETRAHLTLKRLALTFLREQGCLISATEVRCPFSRYRIDVAGYLDVAPGTGPESRPVRTEPTTVMIECKQSRSDFFRDNRDQDRLVARRAGLHRLRRALERDRIRREEPELCREPSLFPLALADEADWDFSASRNPAYRQVLRKLRKVDDMIHGQTKFHLAARYALADRLYIAAPRGLIRRRDVPQGWGLLECPPAALEADETRADLFGDSILSISVKAPARHARMRHRHRLLRNIAVAACTRGEVA